MLLLHKQESERIVAAGTAVCIHRRGRSGIEKPCASPGDEMLTYARILAGTYLPPCTAVPGCISASASALIAGLLQAETEHHSCPTYTLTST